MKKIALSLLGVMLTCSIITKAATNADTSIYVKSIKHILRVSVPEGYDPLISYPLIVGLHYCTGNSNEYRNALKPLCDSLNVIIVCPDNNTQEMKDPDFILASIDTACNIYNIDTNSVYLNGMSCNAYELLVMGLNNIYPFKGIFPWVPYFSSFTSSTFNLDSEIPVVISVGTTDGNYNTIIKLYDSLKAHGADVNLVLVPGIGHTLAFAGFSNEMIRCYHYLNDTNSITIDDIPMLTMINTEPPVDVKVKITHKTGKEMSVRVLTGNYLLASNPLVITEDGNDTVTIRITPNGANRDGKFFMVIEAAEVGGTAIEQNTLAIDLQDPPISAMLVNSDESIEVYPNPAENQVYIKSLENNISVQIFDLNGRKVYSANTFYTTLPIDISAFSKGVYFLKARGNYISNSVRLIKD